MTSGASLASQSLVCAPEGADLVLHLPVEQPLVVGRGRPAGEDAEPAAAGTGRAAAHGHHPLDAEGDREVDRGAEAGLGVLALGGIGMQQIAGGVDGRQPQPMLLQLARQAVALRCARRWWRDRDAGRGQGPQAPTPSSTSVMPRSAHQANISRRDSLARESEKTPILMTILALAF